MFDSTFEDVVVEVNDVRAEIDAAAEASSVVVVAAVPVDNTSRIYRIMCKPM